ncbi:MAG: hypothetical protein QM503_14260 [Bacteroidota bacterium]
MKKYILIIAFGLIIQNTILSQSCMPDGVTLSTQSEIDNFSVNYPNCTEIEGFLLINGTDITNLLGLEVINSVGGDLFIGDLYEGCPILTSLKGLNNINSIGSNITINHCAELFSLSGLENVIYFNGTIILAYNSKLVSLYGLGNITHINRLVLLENVGLVSLLGLENIETIDSDLTIHYNYSLANIKALSNLIYVGGNIKFESNTNLSSLYGLENIDSGTITKLTIANNNSLTTCEVESVCNYLASPNSDVTINNNKTGCNSQEEVEEACISSNSK